jgi:hypothetical protein
MRESHASMLFLLQRKMDPDLWEAIPETMNAEEAMHWKMYSAAGHDHEFLEGMHLLFFFFKSDLKSCKAKPYVGLRLDYVHGSNDGRFWGD